MCEPTHSISQFPPDSGEGPRSSIAEGFKRIMDYGKKIAGWFHFSKMGRGHSESLNISVDNHLWINEQHTRYETEWWDRTTHLDSYFVGQKYDKEFALGLADTYANQVSIGNMTMLRRFLEESMKKSDAPRLYVDAFMEKFLNKEGRERMHGKLKSAFRFEGLTTSCNNNLDLVIKIMMGFTRNPKLTNDTWAHKLIVG